MTWKLVAVLDEFLVISEFRFYTALYAEVLGISTVCVMHAVYVRKYLQYY